MKINFIIIVSYNGSKWIQKCLDSCRNYPVIVVDNSSTDNTVSIIENDFPDVILIKQPNNLGFGKANNIGIRKALDFGADYVFLLNQDAYLTGDTIEDLIKVHQFNLDYGILSPLHFNGTNKSLDRAFSNYISYDKNPDIIFDLFNGTISNLYEVPFVNAAGWLLPKETLKKVGGFNPIFSHYGEDVDYCNRVKYKKFKIGVVPKASILHDRPEKKAFENASKFSNQYKLNMERRLKFSYLNPNTNLDIDENIKSLKRKLIRKSILNVLDYCKETLIRIRILLKIRNEIYTSKQQYVDSKNNYLYL